MAEIGIAPLAATGARSLSSQLQSSLATGSRMHGGRDDALRLALLAVEPPAGADPALDAVPDAVPAADPYPFVFGATGTLQNVAVICSMQIVPVMGACDGACWPLGAPPCCGVFGAAIRSWMFAVGTCAETGDIAGTSAALSVTTNATRFMCPAPICFVDTHFCTDSTATPVAFSTQRPSSTPFFRRSLELGTCGTWQEPGHVVSGEISPSADVGGEDRREGVPDSHCLKAALADSFPSCD
jgi:hypothetical protein